MHLCLCYPAFPTSPKLDCFFWQHYKSSVERERNTVRESKAFTYLENWLKVWMMLKRQRTGQRAVTSRNAFFSPADIFHVLCHTICHPVHLLCQETYAGNRKRPQTAAAFPPRSTDLLTWLGRTKSIKEKWGFHPFPSTGVTVGSIYWMSLHISDQRPSLTTSRDSGSVRGLELLVLAVKLVLASQGCLTLSMLNSCFHFVIES